MCICAVARSVTVSLHLRQSFLNLEDLEKEKVKWPGKCLPSNGVSVIQLHITPPTTVARVNWTMIASTKQIIWPIWRRRLRPCNLEPWRGRLALGNGSRESFKGALASVSWGAMHALSSFLLTTLLTYNEQLEWLTSVPSPNSSTSSFYTPYSVIRDNMLLTKACTRLVIHQKTSNWIPHSRPSDNSMETRQREKQPTSLLNELKSHQCS